MNRVLKKGTVKRVHVSQVNIRANQKRRRDVMQVSGVPTQTELLKLIRHDLPVFTVQTSRGPIHGTSVDIRGASRLVYSPGKPLSCGARVWIETKAEVEVTDADR